MTRQWTELPDTTEAADSLRAEIESIVEGWFTNGPIDWDSLYDRLDSESYVGRDTCCPDLLEGPFWKRVRQIARAAKREMAT